MPTLTFAITFDPIKRHFRFGVHMYLTNPHILSGNILRSRLFFKVKAQINSFCQDNFNIAHNF